MTRVRERKAAKEMKKSCGLNNCDKEGLLMCSSCKSKYYCCREHQKSHWKYHKHTCTSKKSTDENKSNDTKTTNPSEKRQCRCMFCGELLVLDSQDAAVDHMRVCSSLQTQLSDTSGEPFVLPTQLTELLPTGTTFNQADKL